MATKLDIKKVTFGRSSAEREEDKLDQYFISTRSYFNAKRENSRKLFYIGHRGCGKSALFTQLQNDFSANQNGIIIDIKPSEYSYEIFRKMQHSFYDIKTAYSIAWEFTLTVQIFIEIANYFEKHPHVKKNRDNFSVINEYLIKHDYKEENRTLKLFLDYLKKVASAKLKVKYKGAEFEAKFNPNETPEKELVSLLQIEDILLPKRAMRDILLTHPLYIFLDELDTGWDNSDEAKNYVNGLFEAVYRLSSITNLFPFVSLRQDMYNNIFDSLTNAEKIREDIEKLTWDKKMLRHLIAKRILINYPIGERESISYEEAINTVFDLDALDYIISSTLHRPREIIEFCNKCIEEYINDFQFHYDFDRKIDKKLVKEVRVEFSINRLQDICKEYQYEFPNIREILFSFENNNVFYTKADFFEELDSSILKLIEKTGEDEWLKKINLDSAKLFEILFRIGFVKIFIQNENQYLAAYETTIFDFKNVEKLRIHDVFVDALKCNHQ